MREWLVTSCYFSFPRIMLMAQGIRQNIKYYIRKKNDISEEKKNYLITVCYPE